ncbi:MAG: recombination protein O N-terminal domain-containing protein [Opitutaceae bacterium]|jgi:recombinational DNA repair protein (RecF pathway)|nr:recombination protein O N-terminal domain-containing protein [Opitutaceae bacterium]
MPAQLLDTEAIVVSRRPPSDSFQTLTLLSATHGVLTALQRTAQKSAAAAPALDLFDEAALMLESSNQGRTWFIKEARLLARRPGLGRDYDTLRHASDFAAILARNRIPEETRAPAHALLREALAAFAETARPDIVYLKSLYRLARDEGYPVRQQWFPALPAADREAVAAILNRPVAAQTAPPAAVARHRARLETYLRLHTDILLD